MKIAALVIVLSACSVDGVAHRFECTSKVLCSSGATDLPPVVRICAEDTAEALAIYRDRMAAWMAEVGCGDADVSSRCEAWQSDVCAP
jgi:hypothetical protein